MGKRSPRLQFTKEERAASELKKVIQKADIKADKLEKACIKTVENGEMTKDLALITTLDNAKTLNTQDFIKAVRKTLEGLL